MKTFYSVSHASKLLKISKTGLQYRVKKGLQRHVLINDRVFIPDWDIAFTLGDGKARFCTIAWTEQDGCRAQFKVWRESNLINAITSIPSGIEFIGSWREYTLDNFLSEPWPLPQTIVPKEYLLDVKFAVIATLDKSKKFYRVKFDKFAENFSRIGKREGGKSPWRIGNATSAANDYTTGLL